MAAQTIADGPEDSAMVARLAPVVVEASKKLGAALDRLAVAQARAVNTPAEPTALQSLVPFIVAVYRDLPKRNAPSITDNVPPGLPAVFAVEPYLRQVLLNLVLNAGEALEHQHHAAIQINAQQDGDRVVISVEDNGPGIPDDQRETVFAPYFTTKAESGHLGLGLTVAAHLVAAWGGLLHVENRKPDGGTRAAMTLRAVLNEGVSGA